jgi:hypothetical protein
MNDQPQISRRDFLKTAALLASAICLGSCRLSSPKDRPGQSANWYVEHSQALLSEARQQFQFIRPPLVEQYGEKETQVLMEQVFQRFETMLPDLPFIGGYSNDLTQNLAISAAALAFYQEMSARGLTADQVGEYLYRGIERQMRSDLLSAAMGKLSGSKMMQEKIAQEAQVSQRRTYPGDWVFVFVPGDGSTFDYGVDYTECGICKYYQSQGASDFVPYLCLLDFPVSQAMNNGLVRTSTLARGGQRCDFRHKAGRPVQPEWDPGYVKRGK